MLSECRQRPSARLVVGKLVAAWRRFPGFVRDVRSFPPGDPILVTGAPRSGTTWVAAMLAAQGIWHIEEPFNPNRGLWDSEFTYARPDPAQPEIDGLVRALVRGRHRRLLHGGDSELAMMPLRLLPFPRPRCVLVKDPLACLLSLYLSRQHSFRVLALFRHPAGFSSSIVRLKWPARTIVAALREDRGIMEDWLHPHDEVMAQSERFDDLEAATVLWGCLNTILWGVTRQDSGVDPILYEELCEEPVERFEALFRTLGIPCSEAVRARHLALSTAPPEGEETRPHAVRRDSRNAAVRWKQTLSAAERGRVRDAAALFPVPLYRDDSDW